MRIIADVDELKILVGQEVGCSDWLRVDQQRIDAFAAATLDQQWIHVDPERAARESPFRSTIAHGFLTLSLLPHLFGATLRIDGTRMIVNYGLDKVRFPSPVRVDSLLRARFTLAGMTPFAGGLQLEWQSAIECQGTARPVCVAASLMRAYL
jgi:acyl dehydratase